jgi:hypothetical protein
MTDAPKIVLTPLGDAGAACEGDVCAIPAHQMGSEAAE